MVKSIVLILLLFNGDLVLKEIKFDGTVHECFEYGEKLRVELSTHKWVEEDMIKSGWYLNNGIGTWQGIICKDNYEGGITIKRKTK